MGKLSFKKIKKLYINDIFNNWFSYITTSNTDFKRQ